MTRNYCKSILVLLACAAPLTAVLVNAQQESRTPSGHFVLSGSNAQANAPATRNGRAFIGDAEAQTRLDALVFRGTSANGTSANGTNASSTVANAGHESAETSQNTSRGRPTIDALGAEEGPSSPAAAGDNREYTWIVVVAVLGLAVSLAATGYLAWSRRQPSNAAVAAFMPQAQPRLSRDTITAPKAEKDIRPERRAA